MRFLDADTVFITVLGYEMSYLEFFGTVLSLLSVWLVARRNVLTWPVGIAAVVLFGLLFYQIELYSDFVEQMYFFATGFYGWWFWRRMSGPTPAASSIAVERLRQAEVACLVAVVCAGSLAMGLLMANIHTLLPQLFPERASYAYLDAFTTVMSFAAQLLMAHKKLESWLLWILVDVIGIGLYWVKGVEFISLLYIVFLVLACRGLYNWWAASRGSASTPEERSGALGFLQARP